MVAEAAMVQEGKTVDWTADADYSAGAIIQLRDGRAGHITVDVLSGDVVGVRVEGIVRVQKTLTMVILNGSQLFWDHSANKAHLLFGNDRDFQLGTAQADAASADTTVLVNLNAEPEYTISLEDGFATIPIQTAGWPWVTGTGEGVAFALNSANEAQKLDALSIRKMAPAAIAIVDALICINTNGSAGAVDFNVGLANATHATDADSITEHLFCHVDGASTNINYQSKDGTTTVASTDSTLDIVAGTPFLVQFDLRNLADIQVYVNGVNVLPASVFKLNAAVGPLGVIAHVEKTAATDVGNFTVMELGARPAQV